MAATLLNLQSAVTVATREVPERSSALITGTLRDPRTGQALPKSAVVTFTLTLYNTATGTILNGRDGSDILDALADDGTVALELTPDDNALEDRPAWSALPAREVHAAQLDWTYNDGASTGRALLEFTVRNFLKVA